MKYRKKCPRIVQYSAQTDNWPSVYGLVSLDPDKAH